MYHMKNESLFLNAETSGNPPTHTLHSSTLVKTGALFCCQDYYFSFGEVGVDSFLNFLNEFIN